MLRFPSLAILSTVVLGLLTVGCERTSPPTGTNSSAPVPATAGADDHGHSHDDHDHPSEGPHHGVLVELGNEEYHAEVVHDDATGTVTVYLLDAGAKKSVTSDATEVIINVKHGDKPEQFKLLAQPQDGEPAGQSSRYSLTNKELAEHLHEEATAPRISLMIGGQPFSGAIPHEDHAGHDHSHEHAK